MRMPRRIVVTFIMFLVSLPLLIWGTWPALRGRQVIPLATSNLTSLEQTQVLVPTVTIPGREIGAIPITFLAIQERRRIRLEYPQRIRSGDSDIIQLTLELDNSEKSIPTNQLTGQEISKPPIKTPNLYETHNIIAEARFDIAGVGVRPYEQISSPLSPGKPATFYWKVQPQEEGYLNGTIWLFLQSVDKMNGKQERQPVLAMVIEIESTTLLGLTGKDARIAGIIGSLLGGILGYPFLKKMFVDRIRRRGKRVV